MSPALAKKRFEGEVPRVDSKLERIRTLLRDLQEVRSTVELEKHPRYLAEKSLLEGVLQEPSYFPNNAINSAPRRENASTLRVVAWNVERGKHFEKAKDALLQHPLLSTCDILILTEVDHGMARSGNRHVAKELAEELNFHCAFAPAYLNFDKGSGAEAHFEGENEIGLQGNAILSRYPMKNIELIALPNAKDHMAGRERQIGNENAIVATIEAPQGELDAVCIHLSAHSSRRQRVKQMNTVLRELKHRNNPTLLGGDWNTTTYNCDKAWRAILGFWRRVAMSYAFGPFHATKNHYPYPERYFEKTLFKKLEADGFQTKNFNVPGICTLHYDFSDRIYNQGLKDWIPNWCFYFINWALIPQSGFCSFKLDWFAGKGLTPKNARSIFDLPHGKDRISDHDPIFVELTK